MPMNPSTVVTTARLGADPRRVDFDNGNFIVSLRLAIPDDYKDANGEWVQRTVWMPADIIGNNSGQHALNTLGKGDNILVHGALGGAVNREGSEFVKIKVYRWTLLGKNRSANTEEDYSQSAPAKPRPAASQPSEDMGPAFPSEASGMDDIPF